MKNDNTKEKRKQTLPLLYYINKTPLCKQFIYNNLVSNCCMRLENGGRGEIRTLISRFRGVLLTVLETAFLPIRILAYTKGDRRPFTGRHKS